MNANELYISFFFPPSDYVSGLTVYKRILDGKKTVDVLHTGFETDFEIDDYINNRITVGVGCDNDSWECIFEFVEKSLDALDHDYEKIHSRSWLMANHVLACEYKFLNPNVFWSAEFSDPLMLNLSNKVRDYKSRRVNNQDYLDNINNHILNLNESYNTSFPLVEMGASTYFVVEYLTFLFADEIVFTNENQRKAMLDQFPVDIKDFVMGKSIVKMHPTLDEKYYHIQKVDIELYNDYINIAYFGKDYYGQRNFEALFYAVESLNHKFKDKLKIHFFMENTDLLKRLISPLKSSDNFTISKPLKYFEFLNATTMFDVLIVNDVDTQDDWEVNPYLPSKVSDYLGSKNDVWAFCEPGSTLSKLDLRYKSSINDFNSCRSELIRILKDYGYGDEDCSFNDYYYIERLNTLNVLFESEFNRRMKLKKENKSLKKINKDILSSKSWKLTSIFRR